MSTIKISQLVPITLNSNTSNTLLVGVDIPTNITGKITATALAQGLYSNNNLNVGNNPIIFPNTVAQFSGNSSTYIQVNLQNFTPNGSADLVITSDKGTDSNNYVDFGINNSTFNDPAYSAMGAFDGYLYVSGPAGTSNTGNLVLGTASYGGNVVVIAGGTTKGNVVTVFNEDDISLYQPVLISANDSDPILRISQYGSGNCLVINDELGDTSPLVVDGNGNLSLGALSSSGNKLYVAGNTYISGNVITTGNYILNGGSVVASNNFVNSNDALTLASSKTYTDTANSYISNNYLRNATGTFNGILTINDKFNANGSVIFANTVFSPTEAALTIAACPISDIQLPSNDGYMLHISGKQNVSSRIVFDSFGANTYGVIAGRTARGTPTAPQAVANGDILMRLSGNGYGTTKYSTLGSGRIDIVAAENFTDASRATQIQFFTTIAGTNTQTQIASFNGQSAIFTGVVNPQKGFIYNPNVISGIINTLNIDIANNSLYKFNCNATTTINLNGYAAGKVVEVWLTNIDTGPGSNHTITHGCYANNSTIGAASFTLTSLHSAYLRYFSIDGDLANTYVSVNYS
jgi:hypothetical protein